MLPGPRHRGSLTCGRYLLVPLNGNKEGNKGLMVFLVKPTPTRFPTNSLYTPMDNTPLHSISSVCYPWDTLSLLLRWAPSILEGGPSELTHLLGVGREDSEWGRRTTKSALPEDIEIWESLQSVFHCLRPLLAQ